MTLSALLCILMQLLLTLIVIVFLVNSLSWLLNWNLTFKTLDWGKRWFHNLSTGKT